MKASLSTLLMLTALLTSFALRADDLSTPISLRPVTSSFAIEPGPTSYSRETTIDTGSLYDSRYKLKSVSIMDITLSTAGPDLGAFSGTVKVNGTTLFTYDGTW